MRHGALPALAATFLVGAALALPLALATAPGWPPLADASLAAWRGLAYLTLVVTIFGLACQNQAMRRLDASQVATFGNAAPILTVIWGIWLFHETVTPALVLGGVLTLGGSSGPAVPANVSSTPALPPCPSHGRRARLTRRNPLRAPGLRHPNRRADWA